MLSMSFVQRVCCLNFTVEQKVSCVGCGCILCRMWLYLVEDVVVSCVGYGCI
uniref:Uncharacterized protein n=1 Tax=Octopus bimaculoides TaxID=37653 RepID=A0A0L8HB11_OCTBM